MTEAFEAGRKANIEGKLLSDNPYICGRTKLGSVKFAEGGSDWQAGWYSVKPRIASKAEVEAAASVEVSRFRRKSNNYYK